MVALRLSRKSCLALFLVAAVACVGGCLQPGSNRLIQGDYDGAIAELDRALDANPNSWINYYHRGIAYSAKGEYGRAIIDFDAAIARKPDFFFIYISRGNAYFEIGDMERALSDCKKFVQVEPKQWPGYYLIGMVYLEQGLLDRAEDYFRNALSVDHGNAAVRMGMARVKVERKDYNAALTDIDNALRANPHILPAVYFIRGYSLYRQGEYARAIDELTKVIVKANISRDRPHETLFYRAESYTKLGKTVEAAADYREFIRIAPPRAAKKIEIARQALEQSRRHPTGSLVATIQPSEAISAGAAFRVGDGPFVSSSTVVADLQPVPHRVSFKPIAGWREPSPTTVNISGEKSVSLRATYVQVKDEATPPLIPPSQPATAPSIANVHVLVIGAGTFIDESIPKLDYADNDARHVYDFFSDSDRTLARRSNVHLITNKPNEDGIAATKSGISAAIDRYLVRRAVNPDDLVIVYFAGHGDQDRDGRYYWVPTDARRGQLLSTGYPETELNRMLAAIPAQNRMIISDACHSGALSGARDLRIVPMAESQKAVSILLASSQGEQTSVEWHDKKHGVFTYTLIEGLKGYADSATGDGDDRVSFGELRRWLEQRVPLNARRAGGEQQPLIQMPDNWKDVYLTR